MSRTPSSLRLRFETVGSIAAIIVGVAAIMVSWDQGRVMRAQQHASVLPAIQINGHVSEDGGRLSAGFRMRNNGVGPALIHDFTVRVDGETYTNWDDLTALAPNWSGRNWSSVTGRVLGAGEEITAIELFWDQEALADLTALSRFIAQMTSTAELSVCYCSVFGRCFVSLSTPDDAELPQEVASCPERSDWVNQVRLQGPAPETP